MSNQNIPSHIRTRQTISLVVHNRRRPKCLTLIVEILLPLQRLYIPVIISGLLSVLSDLQVMEFAFEGPQLNRLAGSAFLPTGKFSSSFSSTSSFASESPYAVGQGSWNANTTKDVVDEL